MRFEPNYEPVEEMRRQIIDGLTEKQKERFFAAKGSFEDKLWRVSKSEKTKQKLDELQFIRAQCREQFYEWYNQFKDNFSGTLDAEVDWFNRNRGVGMVTITGHNGEEVRGAVYACAIEGKKTWFPETACVYYERGQQVKVKLQFMGGYMSEISVIGLTPGHFDAEAWERTKDDNLAFRCDEEGNAINGLFA